jgi:cysteine desulfurase/selenocysteine lyase
MPEPGTQGLPDIAWLTQMVNEMFRMQPDSPMPAVPAPSQPAGGFGLATPSTPSPPASVAEVPVPVTSMAGVPALDTTIPGEAELRALLGAPPNSAGGFGLAAPNAPFGATPLPGVPAADAPVPWESELRALLGASAPPQIPALTQPRASPDAPPNAAGGFGLVAPPAPFAATPVPGVQAADASVPWESELRALLGTPPPLIPAAAQPRAAPGEAAPPFYFLEEAGHGVPASAATPAAAPGPALDANARRADFPILNERVNGRPLVWLDNGATTHKPRVVIDRLTHFYQHENSNIHRAAHELAARATDAYEGARETVRRFLHASAAEEIVFVRGTTEAINLVAQSWGRRYIGAGDEIVITWLEHHANIVPWQMPCEQTGAKLKVGPVDDDGQVMLEEYAKLLGPRTKLVSFTQVSNALGTITPSAVMTAMAHAVGARVLLDGAQSVSHMRTDVQAIGCDWFVFSGHKVFAPTGIGALYGRRDVLAESPPWQGGGNMIKDVTFEHTEYQAPQTRFEAGTGNIADAVGLSAALDYVEQVGLEAIAAHEHDLLLYATHLLNQIPGLRLLGTAPEKAAVLSFVIDGLDSEAIGKALNRDGIAVRAGHHCAQPILRRFGVEASVRASLALYNTHADIDALVTSLRQIRSATAYTNGPG